MSKYYEQHFGTDEMFKVIPCLNNMSTPSTVVRFRGIIQDMHNTELITGNYLYRESGQNDSNLFDDSVMIERELYYCVPIPGETTWSRCSFSEEILPTIPTNKKFQNSKRKRSDDNSKEEQEVNNEMTDELETDPKKIRQHLNSENSQIETKESEISDRDMLDFPIKGENGLSCLVKIYGEDSSFKNTELVDFVGILIFESSLMCDEDEDFCHYRPEATLVPRLHVLFFKTHKSVFDIVTKVDCSLTMVRSQILEYLTTVFGGDSLVAEMVLYNLISRVRSHNYGVTLGKFVLNIYNCEKDFAQKLHSLFYNLLPSLHLFAMTSNNLEHVRLAPVKDYQKDKLKSGLLQLPSGTHLLLDENSLEAGNLFERALTNISHLSSLISTQKVDYDYSYHPLIMNVDIPTLIISKGKTLFQTRDVNCIVKLSMENPLTLPTLDQTQTLIFRSYISQIVRNNNKDIKLTEEVNQLVSQTFVRNRTTDSSISEKDLHNWLTVAELVHLSFGKFNQEIDKSSWEHAMELVNKIKQRI